MERYKLISLLVCSFACQTCLTPVLGGADDSLPRVELTSKVQTKGPDDPENVGKKIFWVDKADGSTGDNHYWKKQQRFIFKENRHEVRLFVPVDERQNSRGVQVQITETYLHCGFDNGTVAIAGDLMEPIQVKHSFWDFIAPDEVDSTESEDSIKQPHVYIFLVKKYDTNSNWDRLYRYIPVQKHPSAETDTESAETKTDDVLEEYEDADEDSFGEENDDGEDVSESVVLPPLPELIQHVRKLDNDAIAKHFQDSEGDADPDAHDEKHRTALMWLASDYKSQRHREGSQYDYISGKMVSICHLLISAGADPYKKDDYGMTALHWAAASGWHDLVAVLLAQDESYENDYANVRDNLNGSTPLIIASANGHYKVLVPLVLRKAKLDVRQNTEKGWTALMIAVYNNRVKVIDKLLHSGANSEMLELGSGRTLCHIAAAQGHTDSIIMLLRYEACGLHTLSKLDRMTPYGLATKIGHEAAANTLREAKVKYVEKKHEEWLKRDDDRLKKETEL